MTFWNGYYRWFLATEHRWDLTLHLEAMRLGLDGVNHEIGDVFLPAIQRAADAVREFTLRVAPREPS